MHKLCAKAASLVGASFAYIAGLKTFCCVNLRMRVNGTTLYNSKWIGRYRLHLYT